MATIPNSVLSRIDLRHLRYFVAVAEAGSISGAAHALHLSQPPVSFQIKELESALSVQLFIRHRNGISLTEPGKAMLIEAKSVLEHTSRAMGRVLQMGRGELGEIQIGLLSSIMWTKFPSLLRKFQDRYTSVKWTLEEMKPDLQVSALLNHRIDVGLWRSDRPTSGGLVGHRLIKDSLQAAIPKSHPLANLKKVHLKDLMEMSYLTMDMSTATVGTNLMVALRKHGFDPVVAHAAREPQTLMALIGNEVGFALLAESIGHVPWPNVVFRPVVEKLPSVDVYIHVRASNISPTTARFLEVVKEN